MSLLQDMLRSYSSHEAGHAVVGLACGLRIQELTVLSRRDCGGLCIFEPGAQLTGEQHCLVDAAGEAAEELFARDATARIRKAGARVTQIVRRLPAPEPEARSTILGNDGSRTYLSLCCSLKRQPTPAEVDQAFAAAAEKARQLLGWYRFAVTTLAEVLANRRTMSGAEVEDVVLGGCLFDPVPAQSTMAQYIRGKNGRTELQRPL